MSKICNLLHLLDNLLSHAGRMVRDTQAEVRQRGCLGGALSPGGKLEGAVNSTPGSVLIPTLLWGFFPSVKPLLLLFLMSKPFVQDDESLKYLTHEEKDVLLFFEETIDSLEDDFEEQVLCDGGAQGHSPRSLEESASGPSEPEDVVDLVQLGPGAGEPESPRDVTEAAGEDQRTGPPPLTWLVVWYQTQRPSFLSCSLCFQPV